MLRQLNIYFISLLAFAIGVNYSLYEWLSYGILGLTPDLFITARLGWGISLSIIGIVMIILVLFKNKLLGWYKLWNFLAAVVFAMQLPMASLWYMMLMRDPGLAIGGVVMHTLLIALITVDYLNSHKNIEAVSSENSIFAAED